MLKAYYKKKALREYAYCFDIQKHMMNPNAKLGI